MVVADEKSFGDQYEYIVFDIKKLDMKGCPKATLFSLNKN